MAQRYRLGIDLGTSHTVLAYSTVDGDAEILGFDIEQLVGPGEVAARPLFPSVLYQATSDELLEAEAVLPWLPDPSEGSGIPIRGEWARKLGAKTPGRLVTSAKSWLSHPAVDRSADILPWGSPDTIAKISPIDAASGYLRHIASAWDAAHPDALMAEQELVLTVPASFDDSARNLTLEAARRAGLHAVKLLEEPQAACYDWLWCHRDRLKGELSGVRLLFIIDIGGGTTDLTLIRVDADLDQARPRLTRVAVGNHLLLGGDNMDLTLAHVAEHRLKEEKRHLSAADFSQLVEQCRMAKEQILSGETPAQYRITLLGGGYGLVAGSRSVEVTRAEVEALILDGFLPEVPLSAQPETRRSGVMEFGLPYASDPALTRQMARFLTAHAEVIEEAMGPGERMPDAVLLNGGVFRSDLIRSRILDQLAHWRGAPLKTLINERPDQAVAFGAVAYALARQDASLEKIGGGTSRSYFLEISDDTSSEPTGISLLPKGSEEGVWTTLDENTFLLTLGRPVQFTLFWALDDRAPRVGTRTFLTPDAYGRLPPLVVHFDEKDTHRDDQVAVRLKAALSEIGTLDLRCESVENPDRFWTVEFAVRHSGKPELKSGLSECHAGRSDAMTLIDQVFGKKVKAVDGRAVKTLRHELETRLGSRADWDGDLSRALFDHLLRGMGARRRSLDHERLWLSLAGFCLRPGYGAPLDEWRVGELFKVFDEGPQFVAEAQNWSEWWTLWRRIAGGLRDDQQERILSVIGPFLDPKMAKRSHIQAQFKKRAYPEMVRLAGVMERLAVARKVEVGNWLAERVSRPSEPPESLWALGRLGARVPSYGPADRVVPAQIIEGWLHGIMKTDWRGRPDIAFAVMLMARMSGDRHRDLSEEIRSQILERFKLSKVPAGWIDQVNEVRALDDKDAIRVMGEALPPGLRLLVH